MAGGLTLVNFADDEVEISESKLVIRGNKLSPPSKRFVLVKKGLRIDKATIIKHDKKGSHQIDIIRINHLTGQQQVRLHTNELMYPGNYQITAWLK